VAALEALSAVYAQADCGSAQELEGAIEAALAALRGAML
jgi:hypothetical protein